MTDSEKLLFRLQHIIPRNLSRTGPSDHVIKQTAETPEAPHEIEFQMTWGKICGKVWGPEDGHPVFAIHGWLDNCGTFDTLIPLLPKNLRIVALDIAGHGLSDHFPPDISYNFLDCLLAIERFSKLLKWERFSLMGHSMGVAMAMMYSGIFPEKVDKLICLDLARAETTRPETIAHRLRKTTQKLLRYETFIIFGPEEPMSYETAIQKSIAGSFGSLNENACHVLFKRGLRKVDGGYVLSRDRRLTAAPLMFCPKEDQLELARKVTAEVLVIKFTNGPNFESVENFMEHVETLKTNSKRVQFVEVEGMHHTHLTHPELIAPIISEFFNT